MTPPSQKPPRGLKWRASPWFVTLIVGAGVATDLLIYSIVIPVLPFRLESLGYTKVSSLTGWLLFAYSGGLVLSTIPIALYSERYAQRWWPLISGLVVLLAAQILLMEAPNYAVICDTTPEKNVGRQLGFAMMGTSLGLVVGPPIGGLLYDHLGYRAPFIFSIIWTMIDLIGRLLIIERKDAVKWAYDPAALHTSSGVELEAPEAPVITDETPATDATGSVTNINEEPVLERAPSVAEPKPAPLSLLAVIIKLLHSPRALMALLLSVVFGTVWTAQETGLPLHLQDAWGEGSGTVGLVLLAGVVPTLISSPLAGWYADVKGSEWVSVITLVGSLPWWGLMIVQESLALFISTFVLATFFTSGVVSPVTAELAAVSRDIKGVGYAHVYGAFNLAYGIGTAGRPFTPTAIPHSLT
ncbi:hypothetical protein HWV62_35996 [Athelia sp. TMB]|nr:hypothetical protein HWV62_35996 [Athelia sp. TMB]